MEEKEEWRERYTGCSTGRGLLWVRFVISENRKPVKWEKHCKIELKYEKIQYGVQKKFMLFFLKCLNEKKMGITLTKVYKKSKDVS